jgi:hypothetical protein
MEESTMVTGANGIYSYDQSEIEKLTSYLQQCAREQKIVHYDDAFIKVRELGPYHGPHDKRLWDLLGIVSAQEVANGRAALSALVVTKENNRPGSGFFDLERDLGRYRKDDDTTWLYEVDLLFKYWPKH